MCRLHPRRGRSPSLLGCLHRGGPQTRSAVSSNPEPPPHCTPCSLLRRCCAAFPPAKQTFARCWRTRQQVNKALPCVSALVLMPMPQFWAHYKVSTSCRPCGKTCSLCRGPGHSRRRRSRKRLSLPHPFPLRRSSSSMQRTYIERHLPWHTGKIF